MSRSCWSRVLVAVAVGAIVLVPDAARSAPDQEDSSESAIVDLDIDVQRADEVTLAAAFVDIRENVEVQRAALGEARAAVIAAEANLAAARGRVAETQAQIDGLVVQSDRVVVEAFTAPPSETAIETLSTDSPSDAAIKQSFLDWRATEDAGVLEELDNAQEELEERQEAEQAAAEDAEGLRGKAESALDDLKSAVSQEVAFTLEIEERLNHTLGEIAALEETDPELAERLRAEQAELAAQIAEARRRLEEEDALDEAGVTDDQMGPDGPSSIQPVAGGVVVVTCPSGGSIEVAGAIARETQGLLNLANSQGVSLCGYGYRNPAEQVALRRSNCGSSDYAIYRAPPSSCSPPTAIPGSSMHEQGLAIDFTSGGNSTIGCGSRAYDFLDDNAEDYGLYNLPGECWHWSTNGQ